jgi:hypothetical protein
MDFIFFEKSKTRRLFGDAPSGRSRGSPEGLSVSRRRSKRKKRFFYGGGEKSGGRFATFGAYRKRGGEDKKNP